MGEKMRSGRFARLCRTTKDTLRHYEDMGILAPASVAENGYKEYSPDQAMDFMIISALKDAGCSLADIRRFQEGGKEALRGVMADCMESLDAQIAALERKKGLLANSIARIDELETWRGADGSLESGSWRIRRCEEAHYIETRVPMGAGAEEALDAVAAHAAYCEEAGCGLLVELQQATYRVDGRSFAAGEYGKGFFLCTPTLRPVDCDRGHTRPAGLYLQLLSAVPLEAARGGAGLEGNPVFGTYDALKALAGREGLETSGSAYDAELSLGTADGTDLLWKEASVMVGPLRSRRAGQPRH